MMILRTIPFTATNVSSHLTLCYSCHMEEDEVMKEQSVFAEQVEVAKAFDHFPPKAIPPDPKTLPPVLQKKPHHPQEVKSENHSGWQQEDH